MTTERDYDRQQEAIEEAKAHKRAGMSALSLIAMAGAICGDHADEFTAVMADKRTLDELIEELERLRAEKGGAG